MSTIEELLGRKSSGFGLKSENTAVGIRCADHVTPSICKSWHWLRRQAAVALSVQFVFGPTPRSLVFSYFMLVKNWVTAFIIGHVNTEDEERSRRPTNKLRGLSPRANDTDRRLSVKLVPTFANRGRCVVSATNSYDRILGFLDRSRYFSFQVTPQLYSRGWVDPVPDSLLLRKSGRAGNRTGISGSLARNSDLWTTEVVSRRPTEVTIPENVNVIHSMILDDRRTFA
jgi:hypothetical protein